MRVKIHKFMINYLTTNCVLLESEFLKMYKLIDLKIIEMWGLYVIQRKRGKAEKWNTRYILINSYQDIKLYKYM